MRYRYATPEASRPIERPTPLDEALVQDAGRMLRATLAPVSPVPMLDRRGSRALFAEPMTALAVRARRQQLPIELLIVAIKRAWSRDSGLRLRFGEAGPEILAGAVTACIEEFFADVESHRGQAD